MCVPKRGRVAPTIKRACAKKKGVSRSFAIARPHTKRAARLLIVAAACARARTPPLPFCAVECKVLALIGAYIRARASIDCSLAAVWRAEDERAELMRSCARARAHARECAAALVAATVAVVAAAAAVRAYQTAQKFQRNRRARRQDYMRERAATRSGGRSCARERAAPLALALVSSTLARSPSLAVDAAAMRRRVLFACCKTHQQQAIAIRDHAKRRSMRPQNCAIRAASPPPMARAARVVAAVGANHG